VDSDALPADSNGAMARAIMWNGSMAAFCFQQTNGALVQRKTTGILEQRGVSVPNTWNVADPGSSMTGFQRWFASQIDLIWTP